MGLSQSSHSVDNSTIIGDPTLYRFDFDDLNSQSSQSSQSPYSPVDDTTNLNFLAKKNNILKVYKTMESNMNMYLLYDNYDDKNKVILDDLKKKTAIQTKELKDLTETRDKLKIIVDNTKDDSSEFTQQYHTHYYINITLTIILAITIGIIIYIVLIEDSDYDSNNNNISINNILNMSNKNIDKMSNNNINALQNIIGDKLNNINSTSNSTNTSKSNNSSKSNNNTTTKNNLAKQNKFTLNDIRKNNALANKNLNIKAT